MSNDISFDNFNAINIRYPTSLDYTTLRNTTVQGSLIIALDSLSQLYKLHKISINSMFMNLYLIYVYDTSDTRESVRLEIRKCMEKTDLRRKLCGLNIFTKCVNNKSLLNRPSWYFRKCNVDHNCYRVLIFNLTANANIIPVSLSNHNTSFNRVYNITSLNTVSDKLNVLQNKWYPNLREHNWFTNQLLVSKSVVVVDLDLTLIDRHRCKLPHADNLILMLTKYFDILVLWTYSDSGDLEIVKNLKPLRYLYLFDIYVTLDHLKTDTIYEGNVTNKGSALILELCHIKFGIDSFKYSCLIDDKDSNYEYDYDLFIRPTGSGDLDLNNCRQAFEALNYKGKQRDLQTL